MDVRKLLVDERTNAINTTIIDVRTVPGSYSIFKDVKFQIVGYVIINTHKVVS